MNELQRAIHKVARLRYEAETLLEAEAKAEAALNNTPEHRAYKAAQERTAATLAELRHAEAEARELAVKAYRETGSKKPARGVKIAVYERVLYDRDEALAWCKANAPTLVYEALNEQAFRKTALHLPGAPVEVTSDPRARLDADLGPLLTEAQEEPETEAMVEAVRV